MFTKVLAFAALAAGKAAAETLTVNVANAFRPVTHVASGSLYGLADGTIPSNDLITPIKPNTFVQMAPNGKQQGGGDALKVAAKAKQVGAQVIVRMCDYYAGWPYKWVSWDDWYSVIDKMIDQVKASGATNIAAYEIWNEPDGTWLSSSGPFNDAWVKSYRRIKTKDTTTPISGPSLSYYNANTMQSFLSNAKQNNAVPDIISWHELGGPNYIADHVSTYRALEKSLGISPRPISIEEYATRTEVGVPGVLTSYIAKFERAGVHDAELPFWNQYGALGDLLTGKGGQPNSAWYLYRWYGSMSGQMVQTTPPNQSGIDGAASYDASTHTVSIIVGNGNGNSNVVINGLTSAQGFGSQASVTLEYTASTGRTTPASGTVTVSTSTYTINGGSISVPISNMNSAYGYHITVVPSGSTSQPTSTPAPSTSQPTPTTATVKPTTTPAPTGAGAALWGQCGGIGWAGPTACAQGKCVKLNDYYSQCQ